MVVDVLQAFGWRGARQDATSVRETAANVLQPAILQNGPVGLWLTRLSDEHGITKLAPTGVMLLFAILYFGIITDAGTLDPIINRILRTVGTRPTRIVMGTTLLATVSTTPGR